MATTKTLTTEAIALTEKKMDMTLDEIIKMSKKPTTIEKGKTPRPPIKSQGFQNGGASRRNTLVQHVMDSRSYVRQGVLAQRRSNFRGNQFPVAANVARKAAVMPVRTVVGNRRSNFRGSQFPVPSNMREAAMMPIRHTVVNRHKPRMAPLPVQRKAADGGSARKDKMIQPENRPQTMDALFANLKEQRMRVFFAQQQSSHDADSRHAPQRHHRSRHHHQQPQRGGTVPGRWFGNPTR